MWASLTLFEVRASLEAAGPALRREETGGLELWAAADGPRRAPRSRAPVVRLVQGYDEYIMGYTQTKRLLARAGSSWEPATPPVFRLVILLDGGVAGFWKRTLKRDQVIIDAALLEDFDDARRRALEAEAERYGAFLGLKAVIRVAEAPSRPAGAS